MVNRWLLTEKDREQFTPVLENYLFKLEHLSVEEIENMKNEEFMLNLSDTSLNPSKLVDLFEEFGYEKADSDDNGWELDFWIYINRTDGKTYDSMCKSLCIFGCGMTFELKVCVKEFM